MHKHRSPAPTSRGRRKFGRKGKSSRPSQSSPPPVTIVRTPFLVPERISVPLQWTEIYNLRNVGFRDAALVFRPSSAFDVDPALGGAIAYGFTEYAQFYSKYRVFSSRISLNMTNTDLEGITVGITPSTLNPGNNPADLSPYISNPLTKFRTIGGFQGNSAGFLSHAMSTQKMSGVTTTAEDGYSSLTTTNPVENWFWVISGVKGGVSTITNGVSILVKIEITCHFYDRRILPAVLGQRTSSLAEPAPFPPPIPVYITNPPPPPVYITNSPSPFTPSPAHSTV